MDADKHVSNLNPTPRGKGCSLHASQTMSDVFKDVDHLPCERSAQTINCIWLQHGGKASCINHKEEEKGKEEGKGEEEKEKQYNKNKEKKKGHQL